MYPQGELKTLESNKALLRRKIGRQRVVCETAATGVLQPLAWIDRARARWRKTSPLLILGGVVLALVAKRAIFPRIRLLPLLLRWGPLALGVSRGYRAARTSSAEASSSASIAVR